MKNSLVKVLGFGLALGITGLTSCSREVIEGTVINKQFLTSPYKSLTIQLRSKGKDYFVAVDERQWQGLGYPSELNMKYDVGEKLTIRSKTFWESSRENWAIVDGNRTIDTVSHR